MRTKKQIAGPARHDPARHPKDLNLKVIIMRDFQADLHFENQRFQTRKRDWMLIYYLKSALAFLCFLFGRAISVFSERSFKHISPKIHRRCLTLKRKQYLTFFVIWTSNICESQTLLQAQYLQFEHGLFLMLKREL